MKTKQVYAALAAVVAPLALTITLSGIESHSSTREVLQNMPQVPWPLEIPPAEAADAPAKAKATRPAAPPPSGAKIPLPTADASIDRCCAALHGKSTTAREDARDAYGAAARVCDAISASSTARDALSKVQGKLQGAELPLECR